MHNSNDEDFIRLATGFTKIERRHKRFMNRSLAEYGLTGIPYSYITTIQRNPGINQDRLAYLQGVDKSRIARNIRSLEIGGFVSREPYPGDRRRYMLNLTQKGEVLYGLIAEISRKWAALMSVGIEASEMGTMVRMIDKIIRVLDEKSEKDS